jgi:Mrp family chromosome partitioning ATPase
VKQVAQMTNEHPPMTGNVALVTGATSGIGRAAASPSLAAAIELSSRVSCASLVPLQSRCGRR